MDDREAIGELKRGNLGGLEALVARYQLTAARAAYLITGDARLAEDLAAAAFVKAYEHIHQFDPLRPFKPWFLRIVVNSARRALEQQHRHVTLDGPVGGTEIALADVLPDPSAGPEALAELADRRQAVWAALERLAPAQRAVVVQRYYLGLSDEEIAADQAIALGTVRWRLHTARERLRAWLAPMWDSGTARPRPSPKEETP
jgi:RNA polymerase sigma-70 factor (ECF subfamily)